MTRETPETGQGGAAMEAGRARALDARVAVEVMGWTDVAFDAQCDDWYGTAPDEPDNDEMVARYSTNAFAMMDVVEAMRARGIFLDIRTCSDHYEVAAFRAGRDDEDHLVCVASDSHPSLPLAITRAALASLPEELK